MSDPLPENAPMPAPQPLTGERAGRYVAVALGVAAVFLLGVAALVIGTERAGRPTLAYKTLMDYQVAKLRGPEAKTIIVGDSSAGNAIDAQIWSSLAGHRAVSLALSGVYGYEGTYNFIRRALTSIKPVNVVIMHAADMMTRPESAQAYEATLDLGSLPPWERLHRLFRDTFNFSTLQASIAYLRSPWRDQSQIAADYIRQGPPLRQYPQAPLRPEQINPGKIRYLRMVGELCAEAKLNCVYLHGPLANPRCGRSGPYFETVAAMIKETKVVQASVTPFCMGPNEIGDAEDHVRPDRKPVSTQVYFNLLRPLLKN